MIFLSSFAKKIHLFLYSLSHIKRDDKILSSSPHQISKFFYKKLPTEFRSYLKKTPHQISKSLNDFLILKYLWLYIIQTFLYKLFMTVSYRPRVGRIHPPFTLTKHITSLQYTDSLGYHLHLFYIQKHLDTRLDESHSHGPCRSCWTRDRCWAKWTHSIYSRNNALMSIDIPFHTANFDLHILQYHKK